MYEILIDNNLVTSQNRWGDSNLLEKDEMLLETTPCGKVKVEDDDDISSR